MQDTSNSISIAANDVETYVALYDNFSDFSKRFAYLQLKNNEDVEDVVQAAWLRVLTSLHQFRGTGKFSSWLGTIILNECRDARKRVNRARTVSFEDDSSVGDHFPGWHSAAVSSAETQQLRRDMQVKLRRHLKLLPSIYRTVLTLHYVNCLSLTQVAEKLQISESAVKSRLRRARMILATKLR